MKNIIVVGAFIILGIFLAQLVIGDDETSIRGSSKNFLERQIQQLDDLELDFE